MPFDCSRRLRLFAVLLPALCGCGGDSASESGPVDASRPPPEASSVAPVDAGSPLQAVLGEAPCASTGNAGSSFVPQPDVTYLVLRAGQDDALQIATTGGSSPVASISFAPRTNALSQLFTLVVADAGPSFQVVSYLAGVQLAGGAEVGASANGTSWGIAVDDAGASFVDPASGECLTDGLDGAQTFRLLPFKKGMGVYGDDWGGEVTTMRPFWVYDWDVDTAGVPLPAGVEFVPMVWGYYGDAVGLRATLQSAVDAGARTVLAYNEPDNAIQANLAADAAAATWPIFEASGLRLGSPAAVDDSDAWMQTFVADIGGASHVGFLAVHWYGSADASSFVSTLSALHAQYGLPIWVTEFCPADWNATSTDAEAFTAAQAAAFARAVLPQLDALPWLQRFAWFSAGSDDPNLGHSALFADDGGLTGAGVVYQAYPLAAP